MTSYILRKTLFIAIILSTLICFSCKENYTPKPHGYLRIELPENHSYSHTPETLPFYFEYSNYASWDQLRTNKKSRSNSLWYNVHYTKYNAKIHLSYIPLNNNLDSLLEESHQFVFEHSIRADAIDEKAFNRTQDKVYGVLFDLKGNAASNMEFWATDSVEHFLRGALYLETTPNIDSLAPVINYIKEDIIHMINTLEWYGTDY